MEKKLYVVLGDVVSSARIKDRKRFQQKFEKTLKTINTTHASDIYANFKIQKGIDEAGGALTSISHLYDLTTDILEEIHPNLMRFVVVYDYVNTALETKDVSLMDGPAFNKASDRMLELKKSKLLFEMSGGEEILDAAVTGQINLILLLKRSWSERQRNLVREYARKNNQHDVAKKLGVSQQAVSKTLRRTHWKEIKNIEDSLRNTLAEYARRPSKIGGST